MRRPLFDPETPPGHKELLPRLLLAIAAGAGLAGPACSSGVSNDEGLPGSTGGGFAATGGNTSAGGRPSAAGGQMSATGGLLALGGGGAAGALVGDGDGPSGDGDGDGDGPSGDGDGDITTPPAQCVDRRAETEFCSSREAMEHQARYGFYEEPLDPPRSDAEIAAAFDDNGCMRPDWIADGCCNAAIAPGVPQSDGTCCYVSCAEACCGRPLIVAGRVQRAELEERSDWGGCVDGHSDVGATMTPQLRAQLAACFAEDAVLEHASVASFCRFSLQLLALGAPADLVEGAGRATLDEVEHARLCFAVASALGGSPLGPSALPAAASTLPSEAVEILEATIIEGCVGETISAALVREQAVRAGPPLIRRALGKIADDEARHAELAWKTVAWLLGSEQVSTSSPATIRDRVRRAFEKAIEQRPVFDELADVSEAVQNEYGRLSARQAQAVRLACLRDVIEPSMRALLQGAAKSSGAQQNQNPTARV